jgi:hypothetical protein
LIAALPVAQAHHNSAPLFRLDETVAVEGFVTRFVFANPHAHVFLQVTGDDGETTEWQAEGANATALRHNGWSGEEMQPGDRIRVIGAPARDDSPRMEWREIHLEDGTVLGGGNGFPKERDDTFEALERLR